jgi:hypothetical protein
MRIDLDIGAEFIANGMFKLVCDVMGLVQGHVAIDLEIDADRQLLAEVVHGDMVDCEAGVAGNHHDPVPDAFIAARHGYRREGQVGIVECGCAASCALRLMPSIRSIG